MQPFDPVQFLLDYPQFVNYSDSQLTNIYNNEVILLGSKPLSLITDAGLQYYWSCLILAHLLILYNTGQIGRVADATEGSVAGTLNYDENPSGQWWNQTMYGAKLWQLIKKRAGSFYFANNQQPLFGVYGGCYNVW